ncbi:MULTISPECIES: formyltetrahydrofolate deformylase [Pseudonocardia]|uniref:Formyltetrahydrofolate deformylase n=2 Tax=Pseudonocardia TaxID=1847 RepID=A0A1Y2MWG9_PSEAH|nr:MULTISPECIES: formyltetrahydrofolate deformylase [Pseudonocardia]OSY38978.1 Formyltetrahydrofolate deformylase [Pseudonocardia autotrophica]TDN76234.1 formyltetrahydrofolate deformylase [Pseudonocardia autotrophica]BBG00216.1 formyltetrahydrofolate deformylase [Pseudonocardia autotrophica]GEC26715.1 formyltetrahydrofolate deformylase [Pseudonocardia saturnea]
MSRSFVLILSCPNRTGIVRAVSAFLFEHGCDIGEYQQFDDPVRGRLYLRTRVVAPDGADLGTLSREFEAVATEFGMDFGFSDGSPARILVMVSRLGHCLNDLIFRWRAGSLGADIVGVVSNHTDLRPMADAAGLPFVHIPVTPETKPDAEAQLLRTVDELDAELVVLARYMQVLSDETCKALHGRAINIHHSFLPGFKGARPYHQAYDRGVKLVGATAHYVTPDLDEGPIIEQEVIRIDHTYVPSSLQTVGRDAEALALSRAVRWHCERRVLLSGGSTVVFR